MINKLFGKKAGDFYFDLFIAGFIAAIFLSSFNLSQRAVRLPFLIGSVTLLFIVVDCIIMAVSERKRAANPQLSENPSKRKQKKKEAVPYKKILITLCFMVLTVILWHIAGFIISSIIITAGFGIFLGAKNKRILIISAIVLTLGLYWVFGIFLGVPLPRGLLYGIL